MTDFGHSAVTFVAQGGQGKKAIVAHIDTWGAGPFVIRVDGRRYWFTDSDMFGPLLESKTGRVLDHQPGERSAFWRGYHMWRKAGRPLREGFVCRWREPKPGTYWKDARGISHFLTDPEWDRLGYVEVPRPGLFREMKGPPT